MSDLADTLLCACGKPATGMCSKCSAVNYCGRECQRRHWKTHKRICKGSAAEPHAETHTEAHPETHAETHPKTQSDPLRCRRPECDKRGQQRCARCACVRYCSKPCQVADWARHRPECADEDAQRATHLAHLRAGQSLSTIKNQTLVCQLVCGVEDVITNLIPCLRCRRFLCMECDATHRVAMECDATRCDADPDVEWQHKRTILNLLSAPSITVICDNGCHPAPVIPDWLAELGFDFHTALTACYQGVPPPRQGRHPLLSTIQTKLKRLSRQPITPEVRDRLRLLAQPRPLSVAPAPQTAAQALDAMSDTSTNPSIVAFAAWETLRRLNLFPISDADDLQLLLNLTKYSIACAKAVTRPTRLIKDVKMALEAVNHLVVALIAHS